MGEAHDALQTGIGFAHDALRSVFFDSNTEVVFMKPSNDAEREFEEIFIIDDKWFFEYSNFRGNFLLEIAADTLELTDGVPQATHVKIDTDVYEIQVADTLPPKGTDVTWKIYCNRVPRRANYAGL